MPVVRFERNAVAVWTNNINACILCFWRISHYLKYPLVSPNKACNRITIIRNDLWRIKGTIRNKANWKWERYHKIFICTFYQKIKKRVECGSKIASSFWKQILSFSFHDCTKKWFWREHNKVKIISKKCLSSFQSCWYFSRGSRTLPILSLPKCHLIL